MTVYVIRDGKVVEKASMQEAREDRRPIFPTPMISRIDPYESPITGKEITSWRERDADLKASDSVDPRDLPQKPFRDRRLRNGRSTGTG